MLIAAVRRLTGCLDAVATVLPPLLLRLILAYEFGEAGYTKWIGDNWFADLQFPLPFSLLSPATNWWLATHIELLGAAALVLGLGTRLFSLAFLILTAVAIATVHWPTEWHSLAELWTGYAITDTGHGNYKLPLLYIVMLLPLLFGGAGRLSLDHLVARRRRPTDPFVLSCCNRRDHHFPE